MTTIAASARMQEHKASPVMDGVSWETYEQLRRELDEAGNNIRITYDRGRMLLMSPLPTHEKWKQLIGRLIEVLAEEREAAISALGSTTWKREDVARGIEADQCYYIQSFEAVRGKTAIDLVIDPPPDLAVEVKLSYQPIDKPAVYAALRIPELWRFDGLRFEALALRATGPYELVSESVAFRGFDPAALVPFLKMYPQSADNEIAAAFRKWLGKTKR